jgi:hypothetical protein
MLKPARWRRRSADRPSLDVPDAEFWGTRPPRAAPRPSRSASAVGSLTHSPGRQRARPRRTPRHLLWGWGRLWVGDGRVNGDLNRVAVPPDEARATARIMRTDGDAQSVHPAATVGVSRSGKTTAMDQSDERPREPAVRRSRRRPAGQVLLTRSPSRMSSACGRVDDPRIGHEHQAQYRTQAAMTAPRRCVAASSAAILTT